MVRVDTDAQSEVVNDFPADEEERVLEMKQSENNKKSIHTIKEESVEESKHNTLVEESKEPAKPEFAPMHSNPYASKK